MTKRPLTPKQQLVLDCFDGDYVKAAKTAGVSHTYVKSLFTHVKYAHFQEAVRKRNAKGSSKRGRIIASREDRQAFWTKVLNGEDVEPVITGFDEEGSAVVLRVPPKMSDRLKASELLGRSEADFTDKHLHDIGKDTAKHVYGHLDKVNKGE